VTQNGKRRPSIRIEAATASPEEGAAIAAAIEHFLIETAPAPEAAAKPNPWQQAALREGIAARQVQPTGWGPSVGGS
jgi:hypothetical protein